MNFEDAINLVKSYFHHNLSFFKLIQEYNKPTGYWGIKYSYQDTVVFISCDRGGLEKVIIIDAKEFPLWQFDQQIVNTEIASKKNILFTLEVVKKFLNTVA